MKPAGHVIAGVGAGILTYKISHSWAMAFCCTAVEIFMDADHLIEYFTWGERFFSLQAFLASYKTYKWPRVIFILHSYELIILLVLMAWRLNIYMLWAAAFGAGVHIFLDEIGNRFFCPAGNISPKFYFLSYRLLKKFRTKALIVRNRTVS